MTRRETFFSKVSVVVDLKCVGFLSGMIIFV